MTYKSELVAKVATKCGTTKKLTQEIIDALFDEIAVALPNGGVNINGFGTFSLNERAARTGRNPRTGEPIEIAATKKPQFKACKALREQCQ